MRELGVAVRLAPSAVWYHLKKLERLGLITRKPGQARGIYVGERRLRHTKTAKSEKRRASARGRSRESRGDVKMPRHSADEQEALIEKVVRKALSNQQSDSGPDMIPQGDGMRGVRRALSNGRIRSHRVG